MRGRNVALFAAAVLVSGAADAKWPGLCGALKAFERAPLSVGTDGQPLPRSVELLWLGPWGLGDIGYECRHGGAAAGKALCGALTPPPQELRKRLPFAILRCYGYAFPKFVEFHWGPWQSEIGLGSRYGSGLRLDIFMSPEEGIADAIRLTKFPKYDTFDNPLPSLRKPIPDPDEDQALDRATSPLTLAPHNPT
jgi:hypothetical protein